MKNDIRIEVGEEDERKGEIVMNNISAQEEAEVGAGVLRWLQTYSEQNSLRARVFQPSVLQPRDLCEAGDLPLSRPGLRWLRLLQV